MQNNVITQFVNFKLGGLAVDMSCIGLKLYGGTNMLSDIGQKAANYMHFVVHLLVPG